MDEHAKDDVAEAERCDSPTAPEPQQQKQQQQTQQEDELRPSPAKTDSQALDLPYLSTETLPLGLATVQMITPTKKQATVSTADRRPTCPVKDAGSRSSSPIKRPSSRPSSRSNSPRKWTPAPGKKEHFETTPTGFRYTIELPESKIVPKKASSSSPNKVTITPVKSRAGTPTRNPQTAASPSESRSRSPRKELQGSIRAASPEKKGPGTTLPENAEPSPRGTPPGPANRRSRASVKLMKTNGTHVGTPTVKVTKEDVWTPKERLRSPLLPSRSSIFAKTNREKIKMERSGSHIGGTLASSRGESHTEPSTKSLSNGERRKETVTRSLTNRSPLTPTIPTDFGEMLRNSSQDVREIRADQSGTTGVEKMFSSPTVLDKVGRKFDMKTVSFLGLVAKPQVIGTAAVEVDVAPISDDFASGTKKTSARTIIQRPNGGSHDSPGSGQPVLSKSPQTPIGTPPDLVVAIEAEMNDIRASLRRSLGDGYHEVFPSPITTRWLGSSKNNDTSPTLTLGKDTQGVGSTPRLNLHMRMEAAKKNHSPRLNGSKQVRNGAPPALVKKKVDVLPEAETPFRSRLPRVSPVKTRSEPNLRTPGTIPQAPRFSLLERSQSGLSASGGVPSMASRRAQFVRAVQSNGETIGFASAEEIARHVREWNSKPLEETSTVLASKKSPVNSVTKSAVRGKVTTRPAPTFMSPTATSAKKQTPRKAQESFTPPGSPPRRELIPHSARKVQPKPAGSPAHSAKRPSSPPKKVNVRSLATPRTPLPRRSVLQRGKIADQGALRTPSRDMVSKLDREINAHLASQERQGRMFTPSGQRIKDLLAATRQSEGEVTKR